MTLLAELQRRKVLKVGAAYLVVAWLAVQAVSIGFPAFDAPPWALRVFILVSMLGFPVVLVLTWVFDVTPDGVRMDAATPGSRSVLIGASLLIALALAWYFQGQVSLRRGEAVVPATAVAPQKVAASTDPRSIAVLPFVNMSDDRDNGYFSDGISEELLNVLVRISGFSVASRTSSFAFKGQEIGAADIAKKLKVRYILEGSVRKQGDKVRITAQLIDASNDRHVFSQTYDRNLADIFAIQDEIANAIAKSVQGSMGSVTAGKAVTVEAATTNLDAYESYLKARELFLTRKDLAESIRLFERAVALDPKFTRGWEGLAAAYAVAPSWIVSDRDFDTLATQAARKALALDASRSMPWAALALVQGHRLPVDWTSNLQMLDRAVAADPHNATALLWRSIDWVNLGFFDRALADQDRCLAVDPAYLNCTRWKALTLLFAGDQARALALFDTGVAAGFYRNRADSFLVPLWRRGDRLGARMLLRELGAQPELVEAMLADPMQPLRSHMAAADVQRRYIAGMHPEFRAYFGDAKIYLWFGAFDAVGASKDISSESLEAWDPVRPDFRNTAGFKKVLERLGVPSYWRAKGYPSQCHAQGASDFACASFVAAPAP